MMQGVNFPPKDAEASNSRGATGLVRSDLGSDVD